MRKPYLDNIRWMTGVLVVLYHVFFMYNGEGILGGYGKITTLDVQYYDMFLYAVYPWFMLVLFIVSGICARYYLQRHTPREFVRSRTRKLLVPSTVGLFAFQFIPGWVVMSLGDVFDYMREAPKPVIFLSMIASGIGVLWFIQLLWVYSMLLMLLIRIEKDRLWRLGGRVGIPALVLATVFAWASAQVLNTPVITVYRFGLYGFAFLAGYFVFSHDEVIERLRRGFATLMAVAALLGAAFCVMYFGQNYADDPVYRSPLYCAFGWFMCLALLGGMAKYGDFETPFTRWMAARSFGLYVFHYLGIACVALFLAKPGILPVPVIYPLSAAAGFGTGYLLNAVISRIPVYRWCVLGIRREKRNVQG